MGAAVVTFAVHLIGVVLVALLLASVFVGIDRLLSRPARGLAGAETGP